MKQSTWGDVAKHMGITQNIQTCKSVQDKGITIIAMTHEHEQITRKIRRMQTTPTYMQIAAIMKELSICQILRKKHTNSFQKRSGVYLVAGIHPYPLDGKYVAILDSSALVIINSSAEGLSSPAPKLKASRAKNGGHIFDEKSLR